ncbi:MAG: hypothetical protein U9R19_14120 [Bacteroidota bacterium]|nr:hypothetical protein [Bacteroidota bacterium]
MNIQEVQADKLSLISWVSQLQDISLIEKLKDVQRNSMLKTYEASLKPFSNEELVSKANAANKAIKNNEVLSQEDLIKEIENW